MKLRYDFQQPSQKTYRTFPQKVVQSTGLLDRFGFLRWCCPFCMEKPRSQSRKSSGVPVIRITRPRSPDSDSDSDAEEDTRRRDSVGSAGSAGSAASLNKSQRNVPGNKSSVGQVAGDAGGADVVSLESSLGSGELDIINEEMDEARDYDSESIESKESLRSKSSNYSKSSTAKDKTSSKTKSLWRSREKGSVGGDSKESRKGSKESLRSGRDSVKGKESQSEKTRSPMKKLMKHLKRTASSPSPVGRSGDKRSASTRSTTSLEDSGGKGAGGWRSGSKKFSFTSSSGEWRTRSATVDSRMKQADRDGKGDRHRSATSEVIGQGVMKAKGDHAVMSAALDMKVTQAMELSDKEADETDAFTATATWERKANDVKTGDPSTTDPEVTTGEGEATILFAHSADAEPASAGKKPQQQPKAPLPCKVNMMAGRDDDDDDDDEDDNDDDEDDEITAKFKSSKKALRKDSGRETGSEIGAGDADPGRNAEGDYKRAPSSHKEWGRGKRGKDVKGRGRKYCPDDDEDDGEEAGGETTESSPPETPAAKERVYDSSSTKPSSGFEDESTGSLEEGIGQKSGSPSPLVGSVGRTSGRESAGSLASSTDNSTVTHPDEDIERLMQISEKKRNSLTPLGSRSESMASVCSAGAEGRYGTVVIKGEIELGLQYNYKEGHLECHVVQCRDLAAVDTKRNRSDPYVKVYLLPDKSKSGKRKTKVKKHTLNPVFEEVLKFSTASVSELNSRTLSVSVWHSDMFGRNDFLGEVIIALAGTVFDDVTPKWYPLQDRTEPMEDMSYSPKGDLIIALKFVPPDAVSSRKARRSRGALHVLVKEAKSLAAARPHGTADPVCKGLLLPEKGKSSKQKTSVCRKTLNPTWNHTLVFEDTSLQELTERALELSVWDHDRLGTSQFLGGCRLSLGKGKHGGRLVEWMEAAGMEVKLWEQMLERPNLWVEGSIMLRPTMDKPIYSSSMTE